MSDCFNWRHGILSWRVRRPLLRVRLPYWPSSRNDADASTRTATGKPCGTFALARARASEFTPSSDGGLFRWAREAGQIKTDPTDGVKNPPRKKGDGLIPRAARGLYRRGEGVTAVGWLCAERRNPPSASRLFCRWVTPLRANPSDTIHGRKRTSRNTKRAGPSARDSGFGWTFCSILGYAAAMLSGSVVSTSAMVWRRSERKKARSGFEVTLLILPVLAAILEVGPTGDLTFICGASGRPLTKESFGNEFKGACKAAGLPGSAHGVRKIAATRAANSGATVAQLEAILGWQGGTMASLYTRSADRRRLALEAAQKLANNERTSIPAPSDPGAGGKAKRQMKSMLLFRRGAAERTRTSTVLPASTSS
jgi:Phage integrase family